VFSLARRYVALIFRQFYKSLMEWSTSLNRVVLLNIYLGPEPEVASFVRGQLITDKEEEAIKKAIRSAAKGSRKLETIYDGYLIRTNLNVDRLLSEVGMNALVGAVFDLTLGDRVRRLQLNQFSDMHEARELVEGFVSEWRGGAVASYAAGSIWWDGVNPLTTTHARWISRDLEGDPDFYHVFRRWVRDNNWLQSWLESLVESPALVNNRGSGEDPVFSAEVAFQVMDLAKVGEPHMKERA
jgi:hypothetical protein